MTVRVCIGPATGTRCPTAALTRRTRCADCERARDRARGSSSARGYGRQHQELRADYQRRMDSGERFTCWRCEAKGEPHYVDPTSWDLGHDDHDRSKYRGPECIAGNRATSGRR